MPLRYSLIILLVGIFGVVFAFNYYIELAVLFAKDRAIVIVSVSIGIILILIGSAGLFARIMSIVDIVTGFLGG